MNNDPVYQRLRETAWRRKLGDAEQAELRNWLAAHPEARNEWEDEIALCDLLTQLPDVPVSSNFTAHVLQAVEREAAMAESKRVVRWPRNWRVWAPRFALAVVAVGVVLFAHQRYVAAQRIKLAQSVAVVAEVRSLPSPQVLEDFDAISCLPPMPPADNDLLALLK